MSGIWDWLTGGNSAGTDLVNSNAWQTGQEGMSNYQYDPSNPDAWSQMQSNAANYQQQTAGVGSAGGQSFGDWLASKEGINTLQNASDKLKGPQSGATPPQPKVDQAQLGSGSQMHQGSSQSLNQIVQLLNSRRYLPIGYSGGSSSRSGLLGY